ncbi:OmpA family protein [Altererythrobacter sp.]|uniref:OmpA family protein n=1 Tax=Altererythrobacter sp. TaxID=1872480 RepID=UPI003D07DA00
MNVFSKRQGALALVAMLAMPVAGVLSAQELEASSDGEVLTTVYGSPPSDLSGMTEGPEIEGFISARSGEKLQVTTAGGTKTVVLISNGTEIKAKGGFLGLNRDKLGADALLNGLPVSVETVQWAGNLVASKIDLKNKDLKTAAMIRNGTEQRFGEHDVAINKNAAATEALRGRMADIDKYNIKGTTNVYFDTGKWKLTPGAESELCAAAAEADAMDNALLLVVGYTDSVGSQEFNQVLSEKRAGRVVNHLQQACGWKPWRMLTPTGMAEADPLADNSTPEGKAQNRRVAVNILVSKSVEGM